MSKYDDLADDYIKDLSLQCLDQLKHAGYLPKPEQCFTCALKTDDLMPEVCDPNKPLDVRWRCSNCRR